MIKHRTYIQRCFDLARMGAGKVNPNPMVGAVIVNDGRIIGEGFHQIYGSAHAEINAINKVSNKELLKTSTLYVSLEPCFHYGNTPPCVNAILQYQIPRVVLSVIDPNPKTMGKSIKKLESAGIEVITNILTAKGKRISAGFFTGIQKNRPYIVLKFAKSINHKIGVHNQQIWISNAFTKRLTHKWRSELNAIMVGQNTVIADNPSLNNRLYYGSSPVKVLLARKGNLSPKLAAFKTEGEVIVISEPKAQKIELPNTSQYFFPFDDELLPSILNILYRRGINSLLVEGGATLINHFIRQGLWDEARVFISSNSIQHSEAITAPELAGKLASRYKIADNFLEIYKNNRNYLGVRFQASGVRKTPLKMI